MSSTYTIYSIPKRESATKEYLKVEDRKIDEDSF